MVIFTSVASPLPPGLRVYPHMPVEIARLREAEVAELALVRLLARVDAEVLGQRARVGEGLFAHAASERKIMACKSFMVRKGRGCQLGSRRICIFLLPMSKTL